jgi:hypothetical protein
MLAPSPRPWEPEFIRLWQARAIDWTEYDALKAQGLTDRALSRAEGLKLKDVVNLVLHEFFERRHYLPQEGT